MGEVSLERMHQKDAETGGCNTRNYQLEHDLSSKSRVQTQYCFVAAEVIWFSPYFDLSVLS
jgi:hypothetical protein